MYPKPTRNRGVLTTVHQIPLYKQPKQSSNLSSYLQSALDAKPEFYITAVTTSYRKHDDKSPFDYLTINFWSSESENEPVLSAEIIIPMDWSASMYLAALNSSIKVNGLLTIEVAVIDGVEYSSINEIHQYFRNYSTVDFRKKLLNEGAFYMVYGGTDITL